MNNNNQNHFSPLMAALIGGVVGALTVYLLDEKRRKNVVGKIENYIEEGKQSTFAIKDKIDASLKNGRKNLAKKIRQVENRVAQT